MNVKMKPRTRTIAEVFNLCWDTPWRWRGRARGQIMVATAKGAEMMYSLQVEREGKRSDHSCDCKGSRDDIQAGGGEGG
jgi:hypothetical protein